MDATYVRRWRAALRDLLELSAECARQDEQIERRLGDERGRTAKRYDRLDRYLADRLGRLRDEMAEHQRAEGERLDARLEQARQQLADAHARQLRQIKEQGVADLDTKQQQLSHALWLADSVLEGAEATLKQEEGEFRDDLSQQRGGLEAIEEQADRQLQRYRQPYTLADLAVEKEPVPAGNAAQVYREALDRANGQLTALQGLSAPKWLSGWRLWLGIALPLVVAAGVGYLVVFFTFATGMQAIGVYGIALLGALALVVVIGAIAWWVAREQVLQAAVPIKQALIQARYVLDVHRDHIRRTAAEKHEEAQQRRLAEAEAAKKTLEPALAERRKLLEEELAAADRQFEAETREKQQHQQEQRQDADQAHREQRERLEERYGRYGTQAAERRRCANDESQRRYDADRADLQSRWTAGLQRIEDLVRESDRLNRRLNVPWAEACDPDLPEPEHHLQLVRFGHLTVDLSRIGTRPRRSGRYRIDVPTRFDLPAMLALPQQSSLLIRTQRDGRERAVDALHAVMLRLLTALPAGRARFILLDPVGLGQNFAGFMHLADYDETLVGTRIWSEAEHIEQRLVDLTQHMENVIQKYLRNEFDTIVRYNEQAGELAEPYRFVVAADFPANFTDEAIQRLLSIIHSGPRCGVYTLIVRNAWQELPRGIDEADLRPNTVVLAQDGERLVWDDEVYGRFPLTVDSPPPEGVQTELFKRVGRRARQAANVEVPFAAITPGDERLWSGETTWLVTVPMGRCGATRLQGLTIGRGVAQHVLIAGKTGSGKSTLLHVLITNLALWYSPDELEFYLIDFKRGVEFKTYATHHLPHARAIAIESDREFGVSVLEKLDAEMNRRGELFRAAGVQDLPGYREAKPGRTMPRTLLLIDEFQELFTEDDRLAQRAGLLLDRLVRQGRAFGVHVLLGSQTLGGTSGLPRGTMGQMAVRIALQCTEADSQLILSDDNTAAKLLSRPGEAIYNDAGGLIEGNSPFQISWLPDAERDRCLQRVEELARQRCEEVARPIVFEGNAPVDIAHNAALAECLAHWPPAKPPAEPRVWVGEPITIKAPTAARLRRQSGANVVLIGQQDESALAVLAAAMLGLAAQHPVGAASFFLLDSSAPDSPAEQRLETLEDACPHTLQHVRGSRVAAAVAEVAAEVQRRLDGDLGDEPPIFVFVSGLQRFRVLRKREDDFGFPSIDESHDEGPRPDRQLAELLREGPALGVHTVAWCDTLASLERTLDRQSIREFNYRLLFQMSANDSSNLIDSPEGNRLGFYRALLYSEEQGYLEKFRPYAFPDTNWLAEFTARTAGKEG